MTALTNTQKKQVQQKLKAFGLKNNELIQKIIERMEQDKGGWKGISYELAMAEVTIAEFLNNAFWFEGTEEGDEYWRTMYESWGHVLTVYEEPTELTQADIQSMLHVLRSVLCDVTYNKQHSKAVASEYWAKSNKEDPATSVNFNCFSVHNKYTKEMKQREKKLVSLITKLKGMR